MPSQFDVTTERKANQLAPRTTPPTALVIGRNSPKESLEILARAAADALAWLTNPKAVDYGEHAVKDELEKAIAAVKARGDWPLEEPTPWSFRERRRIDERNSILDCLFHCGDGDGRRWLLDYARSMPMTTPQSPKEALPGKFPPRLLAEIEPMHEYTTLLTCVAWTKEEWATLERHPVDNPVEYISLSEHESALAEAVRKARAQAYSHAREMVAAFKEEVAAGKSVSSCLDQLDDYFRVMSEEDLNGL